VKTTEPNRTPRLTDSEYQREFRRDRERASSLLQDRFIAVRNVTEKLAAPLCAEDCNLQSMPDASPIKWHLAHTSWFFETFILERFESQFKPFHPAFRVLFNSYYNGIGDKHPRHERGLISRPDLAMVIEYRHNITKRIANAIETLADSNKNFTELMWLGCNHEEQHQELILTDLKHLLSKNPLKPAYQARWPLTGVEAKKPRWHRYEGGLIEIGNTNSENSEFCFDNETPRHRVFLEPFELASHPVTHGDFAAFIADGGYRRPELWLSLGWDWVNANEITAPLYWEKTNDQWATFTLHGMANIDANTPICHVSFFEADAYARWKEARLPTEAEWEHAAVLAAAQITVSGNFLDSHALHPLGLRETTSPDHPQQLFGDVWEWTSSAYLGYPGYRAQAGATGEYNGKFMCNQFVLRGGSCATPKQHIRATYRNFFPPDARWQFSGLRLARNVV
jgi:ergothioneine biosynthesis protein EgtB